ncbi:MAG: InlB B-repeat-containing protein, partial [Clostridia bacterium]|nr:InlB B-repeat-containing protein [Clostridia bacterium]
MKKGIYVVIITLILAVFTLSACSFFSNEPVEYTITFFSDGGSSCEPIKISEDETKITLPKPVKVGYVFVGWYMDETYNVTIEEYLKDNGIDKDLRVYAKWVLASYVVTIEQNSFNAGNATADKGSYVYNETATLTATTNANYNFLGWYDTNDTLI